MGGSPYRGRVDTCVSCGAELGVGRFCLNCGHPIGAPAPAPAPVPAPPAPVESDVPDGPASGAASDPDDHHPDAPAPETATPAEPVTLPAGLPVQSADPVAGPPVISVVPETTGAPDTPVTPPTATPRTRLWPRRTKRPRPESDWDPREELLPYQEVDDLRRDDPLRGKAWIAWVLGAALLVGLVYVLLQAFGATDDSEDTSVTAPDTSASTTTPAPGSESSDDADAPQGVGKRINLATAAVYAVPSTAEPTTDFDGTLVAYEASQMSDGNTSTTWRMAGDATGQSIVLTLAEPAVVQRVGIVNGYAKQVAGVDWYPNNRRILSATWTFDDGTSVEQSFAERQGMQRLKVPPVQTGTVTLTLTSVTPPGLGNLGRDYTAISEVEVIGRRAG